MTPHTLGPYELVERLGAGGMGVVFRARHRELGTDCALKVLASDASEELRQRFQREGEALARVDDHPNVIRVHAAGVEGAQHYLVMELIEGQDLEQVARAPLPATEAARIVRDLARGVEHVHRGGVLHRDVKPENVLVTREGVPKLVDFGLADMQEAASLTATGQILGTPAYMAPEQVNGQREIIGPASDVYALGGVLFRLLAGRPPFEGSSVLNTLARVVEKPPPRPSSVQAEVPAALDVLCLRALDKAPEKRPSAGELADDLEAFLDGDLSTAPHTIRKLLRALGLLIGLLAVAVLVVAASQTPDGPTSPPSPGPGDGSAPPGVSEPDDGSRGATEIKDMRGNLARLRAASAWLRAYPNRPEREEIRALAQRDRKNLEPTRVFRLEAGIREVRLLSGDRLLARQGGRDEKLNLLVYDSSGGEVKRWGLNFFVDAMDVSADRKTFTYELDGNEVVVRDVAEFAELLRFKVPQNVHCAALSGDTLAVGLTEPSVYLYTVAQNGVALDEVMFANHLRGLGTDGKINALAYSRDGAWLAAGTQYKSSGELGDRYLTVWSAAGELRKSWVLAQNVQSIAFALEGDEILMGDQGGALLSFDPVSGRPPTRLERPGGAGPFGGRGVHAGRVVEIRVRADDSLALTASGGNSRAGKERFNDVASWVRTPGGSWRMAQTMGLGPEPFVGLELSENEEQVFLARENGRVEIWPMERFLPDD